MADGGGSVASSQQPQLPFDPERPLGTKFDRDFFLSPFSIIIEYCNRSTFHTKHRPEKYADYFQATKQAFRERYPAMEISGNPKEHFKGRRAWKLQDELRPLEDVSRPRLGAFEVTLICSRTGPRTVFSKLESGCWPNPRALVERAECVSKFGEPSPRVLGYKDAVESSRQSNDSPLPGINSLKVKRNLPINEPRFKRSWNPPAAKPPEKIKDLKELSTFLCRRGGPSPKRQTKQQRERKTEAISQDFVLSIEDFTEFAEAYLQQEKSWKSSQKKTLDLGLLDKDTAVHEKHGLVAGEEARERFEPQAPSTSRPSSRLSRPGSSARQLVYATTDPMVTQPQAQIDVRRDERGSTEVKASASTQPEMSSQPEKDQNRDQRGSAYEDFEEDDPESQQKNALGDSWSDFEDSKALDPRRDADENEAPCQHNEYKDGQQNNAEFQSQEIEKDMKEKRESEDMMVMREVTMEISRGETEKFGMVLQAHGEAHSIVRDIRPGGKIDEWNKRNPENMICIGDVIASVNDQGAHRSMVDELKRAVSVTLTIAKLKELAQHPNEYSRGKASALTNAEVESLSEVPLRAEPEDGYPISNLAFGMLTPAAPQEECARSPGEYVRPAESGELSEMPLPFPPQLAFGPPPPGMPMGIPAPPSPLDEDGARHLDELMVFPPPPAMTFGMPAPPRSLEQDHVEPPHEVTMASGESLASPSKPSRRPPLPPSAILQPSAPDIMNTGLPGRPEESFTFLQPEGYSDDVVFPSAPLPAAAPQTTIDRGGPEYDYAAEFDDDLDTLDDAQSLTDASEDLDSPALLRAESNSPFGDKDLITNAESSDDSDPEDSVVLEKTQARSENVGSLGFMGLADVEDHLSEDDDEIGLVARAIAHGDVAESEESYNSADIVEVRGRNCVEFDEEIGIYADVEDGYDDDDSIMPSHPGNSRERQMLTHSRREKDDRKTFKEFLEADDEEEDDMLS